MAKEDENKIKISVRNLVEFIFRSGDLDNRTGGKKELDAMQEGSRIHRKIQKSMGSNYSAEVPLAITVPIKRDNIEIELSIEGRADGIINQAEESPSIMIDEIKGVYMELSHLEAPVIVHRAQAMCYAYIYAKLYSHEEIGIQMTYCNLETENIKQFQEKFAFSKLKEWFFSMIDEYGKWAAWQIRWSKSRNESIRGLDFPFSYRPGQKELVRDVYRTIIRDKRLFLEAPTGVGKTISTLFPAVKAMGEGVTSKIFYLTAKTITRTVAEETVKLFREREMLLKSVTITAKEKICILEKPDCNPVACKRAKGHFDRINEAVFDLLNQEKDISREVILSFAEKHQVCPFEMCLDVTTWADCIICDYNYAFDPNVYLKRFFSGEKKNDYVFLIDEAHNLVERAREMYSALLYKKQFLTVKKQIKEEHKKLRRLLEACNSDLLKMKRECDDCSLKEDIGDFILHLMRLMAELEEVLVEYTNTEGYEDILELYMESRHFLNIYDIYTDKYLTYTDYDDKGEFRIKLLCMDPSDNLSACLDKGKSAVFFSATLLPIQYYKEQLGGREDDYAIYAPSPFCEENRLLMIGSDVSTKYTNRNSLEYQKIFFYIKNFTKSRTGNYMVFFPSYQMLNEIAAIAEGDLEGLVVQKNTMTEQEKEAFLVEFTEEPEVMRIAFCVMGGIFSEGIDLKKDRLIGAVIVGTGLPMICNERELFRNYYEERKGSGFDYAYLYQGMNKVLQSAGRVIRTMEDKGAILLLDERFKQSQYKNLFPREWFPNKVVNLESMQVELENFWNR